MIYNQDNAIREFCKVRGNGAKVVAEFNKGRHKLVETNDKERYWCVYKREFWNNFGIHHKSFIEGSDYKGKGESLNIDCTCLASKYSATTLVFIHPKKIYKIYTAQFHNFAKNNNLKHKTLSGEWEYSVPIEMLKELKNERD